MNHKLTAVLTATLLGFSVMSMAATVAPIAAKQTTESVKHAPVAAQKMATKKMTTKHHKVHKHHHAAKKPSRQHAK